MVQSVFMVSHNLECFLSKLMICQWANFKKVFAALKPWKWGIIFLLRSCRRCGDCTPSCHSDSSNWWAKVSNYSLPTALPTSRITFDYCVTNVIQDLMGLMTEVQTRPKKFPTMSTFLTLLLVQVDWTKAFRRLSGVILELLTRFESLLTWSHIVVDRYHSKV